MTWTAPSTGQNVTITCTADDPSGPHVPPGDTGTRQDDPPGSDSVAVTVDASPPSCSLTAPQDGQWLKKGHLPVGSGDEIPLAADAAVNEYSNSPPSSYYYPPSNWYNDTKGTLEVASQ